MPKVNVYLSEDLATAVRDANIPLSAVCQSALERAVRDVTSARQAQAVPAAEPLWPGVLQRFTPRARNALTAAQEEAREFPHNYLATEHILLGMLDEGENLAIKVMLALDVDPDDLRTELVASMGKATTKLARTTLVPFTPRAKEALEHATKESLTLGHNYIGCEHLLLGLIATEESLASKVLRRMGLELRTTRRAVIAALSGFVHAQPAQPSPGPQQAAIEQIMQRLDAIEQRLDNSSN